MDDGKRPETIVLQFEDPFRMVEWRRFARERHRLECHGRSLSAILAKRGRTDLEKRALLIRRGARLIFLAPIKKTRPEKVWASLNKTSPKCGFTITPDLTKRVDFFRIECPKCGEKFRPSRGKPLES
jgi:hypothetical protein